MEQLIQVYKMDEIKKETRIGQILCIGGITNE